jgi:4-hydroxy-3-methylbut-2-enyl diphosphate reductase
VLPTHGTTKEVLTYVNKYFKYVYDLTCKKLCRNFQIVNDLIKKDYQIIYYGKRNHPETNVISSIAPNIIIVENQDDIKRIKFGHLKKYALINQSTFSENFTSKIKLLLSQRIKHLTYFNTTCPVTSFRQKHLEHLTKTELLLIIGDKSSNNANQLLSLAKEKKIKSKLISNINQIKTPLFTSIKRLTIITATSVSPLQVHQIINKIKTTKR